MRNVNRIVGKDGVARLYFRKRGAPSVPLRSAWGSPELEAEVAALLATCAPDPAPGTLRQAARAYELTSADFRGLADSTKYEYRLILAELTDDFGDVPLGRFTAGYIDQLRDAWAPRGHRAANVRLQVLKNILRPNIVRRNEGDPFAMIRQVRRPREAKEPHIIWPDTVVRTVIAAATEEGRYGLARGVAIGRYTGARRGDIVKLTKAARRGGVFAFLTGKRRVQVEMAEPPELAAVLDGTPAANDSLVLAYRQNGHAYTEDGFALELEKLLKRLKKAKHIPDVRYSAHGLRHTFGVETALAGCTDAEGAAKMGHGSPHSFATYRRQADRIRLSEQASAKVAALRERQANEGVQNELQNPCKTLDGLKPARSKKRDAGSST